VIEIGPNLANVLGGALGVVGVVGVALIIWRANR